MKNRVNKKLISQSGETIAETLVAVLNNQQTWGLKDGEWIEMSFASMANAYLDLAQRTNTYRKVLLPGVDNTVLELDAVISVLMQQGDIAFKLPEAKRAEVAAEQQAVMDDAAAAAEDALAGS